MHDALVYQKYVWPRGIFGAVKMSDSGEENDNFWLDMALVDRACRDVSVSDLIVSVKQEDMEIRVI